MLTVVFTCVAVCDGCMFCTIFVAVVMCSAAHKGKLGSCSLQYNWRVGWEGEGFCKCQDREGLQNRNLNDTQEVGKAWRSHFLDSPASHGVSWALGMLMAPGAREGFFLPPSFPPESPPSVSATEIWKGPNRFAGFFFFPLCNILKPWKILWNSSVYRAQVKT